jgi:hypothetical protein
MLFRSQPNAVCRPKEGLGERIGVLSFPPLYKLQPFFPYRPVRRVNENAQSMIIKFPVRQSIAQGLYEENKKREKNKKEKRKYERKYEKRGSMTQDKYRADPLAHREAGFCSIRLNPRKKESYTWLMSN